MPDTLKVGDDHNLTSNRTVGDCHPQYRLKNAPLVSTVGPTLLACPVIINETGHPCNPVLRVETAEEDQFIYLDGRAVLDDGNCLWINHPAPLPSGTSGFVVRVGGPAEEVVTRQMLIEGRANEIFVVSGGYGLGGDPSFYINTSATAADAIVDGDIVVTRKMYVLHDGLAIAANQNPMAIPARSILRLTSDVDGRQIQSITAPSPQELTTFPIIDVVNAGNFYISFLNEFGGAAAANRIICTAGAGQFDLVSKDTCRLWYDNVSSRWRVMK